MLSRKIINKIINKNIKISIAESCTGGRICYELTKIPGISNIFTYGIIAYSNIAKINILKVKKTTIKKYGAVSKQTAKEMSSNLLKISKSDFAISTTGISGPTGFSYKKPIGLVYISISNKKKTNVYRKVFKGTRLEIQKKATNKAFKLLIKNF